MKIEKQNKLFEALWYLGIFAFLFLWFTEIHPMVLNSADDWTHMSYSRRAVPIWGQWGPARVFPEVFMPFFGNVAAFLLMPVLEDYILCQTVFAAFLVSLCITLYAWCFARMMKRLFRLDGLTNGFLTFLFLLLHFMLFRGGQNGNTYLFCCNDLTCYYYYLIPATVNASIAMTLVANDRVRDFLKNGSMAMKGLWCLVLYLAQFSNLPDSFILAVYCGAVILVAFVTEMRAKSFRVADFVKAHALYIGILLLWLVTAVFELNGGRATAQLGYSLTLMEGLKQVIPGFLAVIPTVNKFVIILAVLLVVGAGILFFASRGREKADKSFFYHVVINLICMVVSLVFMILLCAKVKADYINRAEYLYCFCYYGITVLLLCLGYIIQKQPKSLLVVPIALCVLLSGANTGEPTYRESNDFLMDAQLVMQINRDLIDQVVAAEQAGLDEVTVSVIMTNGDINWPHTSYVGDRIAWALYEHGVISRLIDVHVQMDLAMNEKYGYDLYVAP